MAGRALCGYPHELIVHVTLQTGRGQMRACQGKGSEVVVEAPVQEVHVAPAIEGVTHLAARRESSGPMVDDLGIVEVGDVTRRALGGDAGELGVPCAPVARFAIERDR